MAELGIFATLPIPEQQQVFGFIIRKAAKTPRRDAELITAELCFAGIQYTREVCVLNGNCVRQFLERRFMSAGSEKGDLAAQADSL